MLRKSTRRGAGDHEFAGTNMSPIHCPNPQSNPRNESIHPLDLIKEEIAIMKKLNHLNLVSLLEVLDDPDEDSLYMVVDYCKKGVVMKVGVGRPADPYDEATARKWFRHMILGIEYRMFQCLKLGSFFSFARKRNYRTS